MLENRPETQSREKSKRANDYYRGDQQTGEETSGDRDGAGLFGDSLLFRETSGYGEPRNDHEEPAQQLGHSGGRVVPHRIRDKTSKCRAIVTSRRNVGVQDLG